MNLFSVYAQAAGLQSTLKNTAAPEWAFSGNVLPNARVFELSVRCGGSVVSSAVEQGSFASYNKVTEPLEITATLAWMGSDSYLQSVLTDLKTLKESVSVFSIETPNFEYENMTLQNYDYAQRREDGRGALYVNAVFTEIKEVTVAYTQTEIQAADTKDPSAASTVNGGLVQAQPVNEAAASSSAAPAEAAGVKSRESILSQILGR